MNLRSRTLLFAAILLVIVLTNLTLLRKLAAFSFEHEYASHIVLIPFLSAILILRKKAEIFSCQYQPVWIGKNACAIAMTLLISGGLTFYGSPSGYGFSLLVLVFATLVLGAFLVSFGTQSFIKAFVPLILLFLMVPLPDTLLASIVLFLQKGSTWGAEMLFKLTGTPFHREGFVFFLPRLTVEVASQCSGIRSSLALLISCILAAELVLDASWRKLLFLLLVVPIAILKNSIRIIALSLLAIHVDMEIIVSGNLHRRGGIVFFVLALLVMAPILWILRRSERHHQPARTSQT